LNALRVALSIFSGKYSDKSISAKPAGVAEMLFYSQGRTDRQIHLSHELFSGSYWIFVFLLSCVQKRLSKSGKEGMIKTGCLQKRFSNLQIKECASYARL
jgi:hypothetical protein